MSFYEVMESVQGNSQGMHELQCLQFIQDNSSAPQSEDHSFQGKHGLIARVRLRVL